MKGNRYKLKITKNTCFKRERTYKANTQGKNLEKKHSQTPTQEKHETVKRVEKKIKEFENVIAYLLFQSHRRSQIKVNIFIENLRIEKRTQL